MAADTGRCPNSRSERDHAISKEAASACGEPCISQFEINAAVCRNQLPPTKKALAPDGHCLQEDERFGFQPGQWVDFHAPGVPTIGGYSIVSPPSQLKELHSFDIAVKESRHPPAHWVHTKVRIAPQRFFAQALRFSAGSSFQG